MAIQSSTPTTWYADRVLVVLLSVLFAAAIFAAADVAIWWANGFKLTELNGGALRHYDSLSDDGFLNHTLEDSWKPMHEALAVVRGPDASNLYQKLFFENKIKFQYPPTSLIYFLALDQVGLTQDTTLNNINAVLVVAEVTLLLWLFTACFRLMQGEPTPRVSPLHLVLLAGAALVFYPFVRAYYLGQIQIWLDVLFTAACLAWVKDRRVLAGVLIGLAATIKPQLALFLIWGLLWRQWPFVAGVLGAAIGVGLLSLALFGLHNHIEYLRVLSFIGSHGEIFHANQSVNGLLNRLVFPDIDNMYFGDNEFAPFSPIVSSLTLLSTLLLLGVGLKSAVTERGRDPGLYDFGLLAICVTIASPVAWEHHYGILLPLFAIALATLYDRGDYGVRDSRALIPLAVSWILVGNYLTFFAAFKGSWLNMLQSHTLVGGLVLALVYARLARRSFRIGSPAATPVAAE